MENPDDSKPKKADIFVGAVTKADGTGLSEEEAGLAERAQGWVAELVENAFELTKKTPLAQTCLTHELLLESTLAFDVILDERLKVVGRVTVGWCRLCRGRVADVQAQFVDLKKPPPKLVLPK